MAFQRVPVFIASMNSQVIVFPAISQYQTSFTSVKPRLGARLWKSMLKTCPTRMLVPLGTQVGIPALPRIPKHFPVHALEQAAKDESPSRAEQSRAEWTSRLLALSWLIPRSYALPQRHLLELQLPSFPCSSANEHAIEFSRRLLAKPWRSCCPRPRPA